jgi:hypothetical protein
MWLFVLLFDRLRLGCEVTNFLHQRGHVHQLQLIVRSQLMDWSLPDALLERTCKVHCKTNRGGCVCKQHRCPNAKMKQPQNQKPSLDGTFIIQTYQRNQRPLMDMVAILGRIIQLIGDIITAKHNNYDRTEMYCPNIITPHVA